MQIRPLNDFLSIKPIIPNQMQNGIMLAGNRVQITEGYVLSIGTKVKTTDIRVGDKIVFAQGSIQLNPVWEDGEKVGVACLVHAEHVIGFERQ